MSLVKAIRSFSRLRQIVNILFTYGFEEIVDELRFRSHLPFEKQISKKKSKKSRSTHAVRLRKAMEEAGGAFVKLAQMLSLRSDLIPQEYCDEFAKLQDSVKPFAFSKVKKIIEEDFGKPINKVFMEFEKEPIAAASVGQVHKARLKSGQWVAVKIQRPDIKKIFKSDVDILYYLAEQAEERIENLRRFKPRRIVQEFENYTKKELDFKLEAKNIDIFFKKYKYSHYFKIPRVYWEQSSSRVVTMTFIDGKKISEMKKLDEKDKKRLTLLVYRSFIDQVFNMHIFHADPHPGNIFLMDNKKIAFLDFGIVGRISPDLAMSVEMMLIGLVKGDLDMLAQSFLDIGVIPGDIDEMKFKEDIFEAWSPYHGSEVSQINMASFFTNSFELARKYNIEYPGNFVLLTKAVITTEAFGRSLYPQANFVKICTPQVEKLLVEQNKPSNLFHNFKKGAFKFSSSMKKFPQDLRSLMYIFKKGATVKVDIDNQDLKHFTRELDASSNRVTLGLIIGSLVVGAGLIILSGIPPMLLGVPLMAWLLVLIACMLSMALTISIIREQKGGEL
ncbi:AarF/ABC1/UbiB kinase family protein [archaeon]|nr:AarF/ABC1/UbiB kinase family protein [archaeon]MBT3731300.1 AarF/ABC1/UbiB kinase family protein [archaeon]MBT4669953.1 AarF/ABC1/UbiB kinase family protein [archaeon]MBT5029778.1 AarF/ABC1/UbiB kinase family protein [archaeon]MBT5287473.1 AarF/ABC1/UbiB kinase family protein [archaeon]